MTEDRKKPLTVGELKLALAQYPDETFVYTEGCDCIGPAGGVSVDPTSHFTDYGARRQGCLIITRDDSRDG